MKYLSLYFFLQKSIILLCCSAICLASHLSHHSHTIPVEGYETELQNLGEHVEIPETPVKVIKITKTIAVKVPVPYPVKVVEKVPYPVHVNKPYPVPVPQIIKVPVSHVHGHGHEALDVGHGHQFQDRQQDGNSYQVQEEHHDAPSSDSYDDSGSQSFEGQGNSENSYGAPSGDYNSQGSSGAFYGQAPQDYHGFPADQDGHNSFESKNYDQAIQNYWNKINANGNVGHPNNFH